MLLKLLNLRKYFDEIVFQGGALRFWLEAFTKYMSPCQLLLLGQQWWETRVFQFRQDVTATAWGSSWVASYVFSPVTDKIPGAKDSEVKCDLPFVKIESRWLKPQTCLPPAFPNGSSFLFQIPKLWFSCRSERPEQLKAYFGWNSEQFCSQSLLLINSINIWWEIPGLSTT